MNIKNLMKKYLTTALGFMFFISILGGCSKNNNIDLIVPPDRTTNESNRVNYDDKENGIAAETHIFGNTSGNLYNWGYFAEDDEWIYYRNYNENLMLYKRNKDTLEEISLADKQPYFINVVDDWCYFVTYNENYSGIIYRVKTDGSKQEKLAETDFFYNIISMSVVDDWIYYSSVNYNESPKEGEDFYSGYTLYKMKEDGTLNQKVLDEGILSFAFDSKYLYYRTYENEEAGTLYKTPISGGERTEISSELEGNFVVDDDKIYFLEDNILYSINSDEGSKNKVSEDVHGFNIDDENIYFTKATEREYEINGFMDKEFESMRLYKMRKDGSHLEEIKIESDQFPHNYFRYIGLNSDSIHVLVQIDISEESDIEEDSVVSTMYTLSKDNYEIISVEKGMEYDY